MARQIDTQGLFKPAASRQESKAQITSNTAHAIGLAEAKARDVKTARLRELRLQKEVEAPPVAPPAKRAAKAKPAK